jgi:hypothetical protein
MYAAFPRSDYYGGSAPFRADQRSVRSATRPRWTRGGRQDAKRFPCSLRTVCWSRSPTVPQRHRREYTAEFLTAFPSAIGNVREVRHREGGCASPPAQIHQVRAGTSLRDVKRRFLAYSSPSRSPDPRHLAVLTRPGFVRAAPTHSGTTRTRLPSATPPYCDRTTVEVSHPHSVNSASRRNQLSLYVGSTSRTRPWPSVKKAPLRPCAFVKDPSSNPHREESSPAQANRPPTTSETTGTSAGRASKGPGAEALVGHLDVAPVNARSSADAGR